MASSRNGRFVATGSARSRYHFSYSKRRNGLPLLQVPIGSLSAVRFSVCFMLNLSLFLPHPNCSLSLSISIHLQSVHSCTPPEHVLSMCCWLSSHTHVYVLKHTLPCVICAESLAGVCRCSIHPSTPGTQTCLHSHTHLHTDRDRHIDTDRDSEKYTYRDIELKQHRVRYR